MDEGKGRLGTDLSDGELVRCTLDGDAAAFEALLLRYQPLVQGYARHLMGQDPIAEDLIQESFIRAFTGLASLEDPQRFGAWLKSIVWRQCRDWVRRRRATAVRIDGPFALAASEAVLSHDPADDLWLAGLEQTIEEMSDGSRIALAMYYVLDEPQLRIAAFLEVPLGTVKRRISDGCREVRAVLGAQPLDAQERRRFVDQVKSLLRPHLHKSKDTP